MEHDEPEPQEPPTNWQSQTMQLQSERHQLEEKNTELTRELRQAKQTLELYGQAFGFKIPKPPQTTTYEPFSQ